MPNSQLSPWAAKTTQVGNMVILLLYGSTILPVHQGVDTHEVVVCYLYMVVTSYL